jgi:hypothetical protein
MRKFEGEKLCRCQREGVISLAHTFIWIGPTLVIGLYQRRIGNYLMPGIRKNQLILGNVRDVRGLGIGGIQGNENPIMEKECQSKGLW